MRSKVGEVDPLERLGVGPLEHDLRGDSGFERLDPTAGTQAPPVAGDEPGEAVFGARGAQVVALFGGELEERVRHHRTHDVEAGVLGMMVTTSRAREAGHRVVAAGLQFGAEHVSRHEESLPPLRQNDTGHSYDAVMGLRFPAAGRDFTTAVGAAIREAKGGDPLRPVRVVVPSNTAGLSLRRVLGSGVMETEPSFEPPGVVNVDFSTPFQFAALLGAERLARAGERPVTNAVLAAAVRHVLATEPGRFGVVAEHVATESALVRAYAEVTALPASRRRALYDSTLPRTLDVLRFVDAVETHLRSGTAETYHDELAVLTEASDRCEEAPLAEVVVLAGPFGQGMASVEFLRAAWSASSAPGHAVFAMTGDSEVDEATLEQATSIVGRPVAVDRRPTLPLPDTMVPVADSDEEVRVALRSVLAAADAGARFERIAVFVPGAEPYLRTVREQFEAAAIPTAGPEHRTLADSVTGRLLLRLVALADSAFGAAHDQRFSRETVLALVEAAPLRGPDGRPVDSTSWENLSRSAGVVAGPDEWSAKLETHARSLRRRANDNATEASAGFLRALEREAEAAERLQGFVEWLVELTSPEAMGRTWSERSTWARGVLERLLPPVNRRGRWPEAELDAADRVDRILSRVAVLDSVEPALTQAAFVRALHLELDAPVGRRGRFGTGVLVAPLASAVGMDLDHVFVLGLAEGVCPRPIREDTLLPDAERQLAGGALPLRADRNRIERERFLHAVASASTSCTFIMPLGDHRSGRARTASRWWVEAARLRSGDPSISSQSWADLPEFDVSPCQSFQQSLGVAIGRGLAVSHADLQLHHVHRAQLNDADAPDDVLAGPLRRGLAHIGERRHGFGRFAGDLVGVELPLVADENAVMSSSRLEAWATCPRRYFFAQLLGLGEVDRPEEITEISALDRGSLWHAIVEDFIRDAVPGAPDAPTGPDAPWAAADEQRLIEIARRRYAEYEALGRTGRSILWEIKREETDSDLQTFLREDEALRARLRTVPHEVELPFGLPRPDGSEGAEPVSVALSDGRRLRLRGLIDRVDVRPDGTPVVLDYKTGKFAPQSAFDKDPVLGGTKLQLGVYAEAAMQHYETTSAEAHYWYTSTRGEFRTAGYPWTDEHKRRFTEALDTIVTGIESGLFPPNPGDYNYHWSNFQNCSFCEFTRICPVDRDEEFERAVLSGRLSEFVLMHAGPIDDDGSAGAQS